MRLRRRLKRAVGRVTQTLFLAILAVALAGCPDKESQSEQNRAKTPEAAEYGILDTFEVGKSVYVRALTVEAARGALWVGTSTGALEIDLATQAVRNTFTRKQGLANEYVFAVGVDQIGQKWFGTNAGGMSRYKAGVWKTYFPMHGLADYWVYSFANEGEDHIWIGTWAGANRLNIRTGKMQTFVKELVNEWVYGIDTDSSQRVWFGTEGGVSMFDGRKWTAWTHHQGLGAPNKDNLAPNKNTGLGTRSRHDLGMLRAGQATYNPSYVFSIHVTPDDTVWAGTWGGGVGFYDGRQWRNLTVDDGLAGNIVYSMAQDGYGVMWFGTDHGISRYAGNAWRTFDHRNGLPFEHIYALAADPVSNDIWAGTRGGVVRIGRRSAPQTQGK